MHARLAKLLSTRPRLILSIWAALVVLAVPYALRVGEVLDAQPSIPAESVPSQVQRLLDSEFNRGDGQNVILLTRSEEHRVGEPGFDLPYQRAVDALQGISGVGTVVDHRNSGSYDLVGEDGHMTVSLITISSEDRRHNQQLAAAMRTAVKQAPELNFWLAGGPATGQELEAISVSDATRAEVYGLPLSLLVLAVAFGALMASALPLLMAVVSIILSFALLFLLGQFMSFAVFAQTVVTMLGLATGIDYALLMVNRFREELRNGLSPERAAYVTSRTAGKAVTFSGLTVLIALASLLIPPLPFIRSIGVSTMLVLVISVLVNTTVLPALLALLGERVNLGKITRRKPGMRSRTFWRRRAQTVLARPWAWATGGVLVLLLLSAPATGMQVADPGARGLNASTDSRQVVEALEGLGLEGLIKPVELIVDFGDEGFYNVSNQRRLSQFTRTAQELPSVGEAVSAMSSSTGVPPLFLYQYYATQESALNSELGELVSATVSESGRYALVTLLPLGNLVPGQVAELRSEIADVARDLGVTVLAGGTLLFEAEWANYLYDSFPLAVGLVYLGILIVLGLAFRSILIPLKSILLNTLTVTAAYGIITLIFQAGVLGSLFGVPGGLGYIDTSAPLFLFAIVFGLSMDYEVFLVARIHEAHRDGLSDADAVKAAITSTGSVITSAAAVMIVVFSSFIFSNVVLIKTLGLGLALAVLLDATLVRLALVPAMMFIAGRWNWWLPRPVARRARRAGAGHD